MQARRFLHREPGGGLKKLLLKAAGVGGGSYGAQPTRPATSHPAALA
jgi:hypothetical protein